MIEAQYPDQIYTLDISAHRFVKKRAKLFEGIHPFLSPAEKERFYSAITNYGLTTSELEILYLKLFSSSRKEIADNRNRSEETVRNITNGLYGKLFAHLTPEERTDYNLPTLAAKIGLESGLIPVSWYLQFIGPRMAGINFDTIFENLTDKEKNICSLMQAGLSNLGIAKETGTGADVIKNTYAVNIYRALEQGGVDFPSVNAKRDDAVHVLRFWELTYADPSASTEILNL